MVLDFFWAQVLHYSQELDAEFAELLCRLLRVSTHPLPSSPSHTLPRFNANESRTISLDWSTTMKLSDLGRAITKIHHSESCNTALSWDTAVTSSLARLLSFLQVARKNHSRDLRRPVPHLAQVPNQPIPSHPIPRVSLRHPIPLLLPFPNLGSLWFRTGTPNGQPFKLLCFIQNYPLTNFALCTAIYVFVIAPPPPRPLSLPPPNRCCKR